ncbi:hypothetical protein [Sorangium sp. So ce233]|uniref:hypothetical protein n=1 Tax=Sorangium sp. So ce233 TaxID=3133290 RepID=UPI003F62E046
MKWIEQTLAATGTATPRRRSLPVEQGICVAGQLPEADAMQALSAGVLRHPHCPDASRSQMP